MKLEISERKREELNRIFNLVWENVAGEKGGFTTPEEEAEAKKRGEVMMERFWGNAEFRTRMPAQFPGFPKVDLGPDLILTGKLDWIQKEPDGSYTIIDFKTGKNKERGDSYQLPIYTILVKKILRTDEVRAKYWYLEESPEMEDMKLPDLEEAFAKIKKKGEVMQMVRQTNSYQCQSGGENCWACQEVMTVANGGGKLVKIDQGHNQEIYILPKITGTEIPVADDIPF
jgi:ATP-dependent helicase/DNAse subunit B